MASRSSGSPDAGVYLWYATFRQAASAAATMCAGVGKSGSPAPKPITGSPAACSAFALASTASVADSVMAAIWREILLGLTRMFARRLARSRSNSWEDTVTAGAIPQKDVNSPGAAAPTGHSGAVTTTPAITIPSGLLPRDGRFGSGPSKVRQEAIVDLLGAAPTYLGTSHRQPTV